MPGGSSSRRRVRSSGSSKRHHRSSSAQRPTRRESTSSAGRASRSSRRNSGDGRAYAERVAERRRRNFADDNDSDTDESDEEEYEFDGAFDEGGRVATPNINDRRSRRLSNFEGAPTMPLPPSTRSTGKTDRRGKRKREYDPYATIEAGEATSSKKRAYESSSKEKGSKSEQETSKKDSSVLWKGVRALTNLFGVKDGDGNDKEAKRRGSNSTDGENHHHDNESHSNEDDEDQNEYLDAKEDIEDDEERAGDKNEEVAPATVHYGRGETEDDEKFRHYNEGTGMPMNDRSGGDEVVEVIDDDKEPKAPAHDDGKEMIGQEQREERLLENEERMGRKKSERQRGGDLGATGVTGIRNEHSSVITHRRRRYHFYSGYLTAEKEDVIVDARLARKVRKNLRKRHHLSLIRKRNEPPIVEIERGTKSRDDTNKFICIAELSVHDETIEKKREPIDEEPDDITDQPHTDAIKPQPKRKSRIIPSPPYPRPGEVDAAAAEPLPAQPSTRRTRPRRNVKAPDLSFPLIDWDALSKPIYPPAPPPVTRNVHLERKASPPPSDRQQSELQLTKLNEPPSPQYKRRKSLLAGKTASANRRSDYYRHPSELDHSEQKSKQRERPKTRKPEFTKRRSAHKTEKEADVSDSEESISSDAYRRLDPATPRALLLQELENNRKSLQTPAQADVSVDSAAALGIKDTMHSGEQNKSEVAESNILIDTDKAEKAKAVRENRDIKEREVGITSAGGIETKEEGISKPKKAKKAKTKQSEASLETNNALIERKIMMDRQCDQINLAAALVVNSLLNGPWPSPSRDISDENDSPNVISRKGLGIKDKYASHSHHMSMVGVSLKEYARDAILPTFQAELQESIDDQRVLLGALLLLREVLTQNAELIFGAAAFDFTGDVNTRSPPSPISPLAEFLFSARVLVNAIILAGIEGTFPPDVSASLSSEFLEMSTLYDRADDDYVRFLVQTEDYDATAQAPSVLRQPASSSAQDREAMQITLRLQRNRHHLVTESIRRKYETADQENQHVFLPSLPLHSTAAHVTLLEADSTW